MNKCEMCDFSRWEPGRVGREGECAYRVPIPYHFDHPVPQWELNGELCDVFLQRQEPLTEPPRKTSPNVPKAFWMPTGGEYHDSHSGQVIPNFVGKYLMGEYLMETWFENGERAHRCLEVGWNKPWNRRRP